MLSDFFALDVVRTGKFSCAVGNPPFIRYQRFNGNQRTLALRRAAEAGVELPALTSAWAPFIIHTSTFLQSGGRLAMVAPAELCHATYARPVLRYLRDRFRVVRVLTFERKLFPDINEDTVLILGDGYGESNGDLRLVPLKDASSLKDDPFDRDGISVRLSEGQDTARLVLYLLPAVTRDLYRGLVDHDSVTRLRAVGTARIGYVTGNNDFFHLASTEAKALGIPARVQRRAVCRAGWFAGLRFTGEDWAALDADGLKTRLLKLSSSYRPRPASSVTRYLRSGVRRRVNLAYKCRVRDPWYAVPYVQTPDLFLTYMANVRPALVLNEARAVAPNTLLCVKVTEQSVPAEALAAAWWTSLTALSAEIEGHGLGGGMLKLEPGEAARLPFPIPPRLTDRREAWALVSELDSLIRNGRAEAALDLGDREILQAGLGLSSMDCLLLRQGYHALSNRRLSR